jgi:predicted dehydrogenase
VGAVRVGVIGTGFGSRVVAPAFAAAGCQVTDVVSARDAAAVAALCRSDVDLVCVHSPPFLHADHVGRALDGGHAVLCDKPFGRTAEDAVAMRDRAVGAGMLNFVNFELRFEPARLRLKALIDSGAIGHPEHVQWIAMTAGSRAPLRPYGWLFDASLGGGWIGAWGAHVVDALRWLMGDVGRAGAFRRVVIRERPDREGVVHRCDAEDAFTAWFELEGGVTAAVDTSFAHPVTLPSRVAVSGTEGVIEMVNDRYLTLRRPDGTRDEQDAGRAGGDPHGGAMARWAATVGEAVRNGRQITPSFDDGVACARVMDALRSSPVAR